MQRLFLSGYLLWCAGVSLNAQTHRTNSGQGAGISATAYQQNTPTINIAAIKIKDSFYFNTKNLKQLPAQSLPVEDYAFSYTGQCFYYIKTLNVNKMQYSMVKCGPDNKEMRTFDISTWIQHFVQRTVDSGLCKSWHQCFQFDFRAYHRFLVLNINYSGERHPGKDMNQVIVFGPELNIVGSGEDIKPSGFLANKKLLRGSDSLFLEDLKGEQLVSYKDSIPATIYRSKANEAFFWDRENGRYYSAATDRNTMSVYDLFNQHTPILKISGLDTSSYPLFIDNNLLFIFQNGNIYHINIETAANKGYRISPANYTIYPNKNGFFCDYPSFEKPGSSSYMHAYSFIPIAGLK